MVSKETEEVAFLKLIFDSCNRDFITSPNKIRQLARESFQIGENVVARIVIYMRYCY